MQCNIVASYRSDGRDNDYMWEVDGWQRLVRTKGNMKKIKYIALLIISPPV